MAKKKQQLSWYHRERLELAFSMLWFRLTRRTTSVCNWVWAAPNRFSVVWKFAKFLLLTIPPIGLAYVTTQIGASHYPYQNEFAGFIQKNPWSPLLLLLGPAILGFFLDIFENHCAEKLNGKELDQDEFYVVLRAIEHLVAKKRNLLTQTVSLSLADTLPRESAFTQLAKPNEQIQEIVFQLYLCIREITGDDSLKVGFVKIREGLPIADGAIFQPITSSPSPELFEPQNARQTLFYDVAAQRKAAVIGDLEAFYRKTKRERRNYLFVSDKIDVGSIQCMPVIEPTGRKTVYALSLLSDRPDLFSQKNQKKIQSVADYFITRIVMEHLTGMLLANTSPHETATTSSRKPFDPRQLAERT